MIKRCGTLVLILGCFLSGWSQSGWQEVALDDLSFFKATGENWQVAGRVQADLKKDEAMTADPGIGILVNLPTDKAKSNIFSQMEHGDLDLELEVMMARHSNSGIYLQGRYEIQLLDSWQRGRPSHGDIGGVFERWDDDRPEGYRGYEGHPPRQNVSRAPGLWQKMSITFQAPRFDEAGRKIKNAMLLEVKLNGYTIHQNLELTGPTRGPAFAEEGPLGPLLIQGDHGPVAFRNIRYRKVEPVNIVTEDLSYAVYLGNTDNSFPDLEGMKPAYEGKLEAITHEVVKENEHFIQLITGTLILPDSGEYTFFLKNNGWGDLWIDDQEVAPYKMFGWDSEGKAILSGGAHRFRIRYQKRDPWYSNGLGLWISGPGFRMLPLHTRTSFPETTNLPAPIEIRLQGQAQVMRCFIDFTDKDASSSHRIVHAISTGLPGKASYTFDPDRAAWVQVWRGEFLDATPMWDKRGDGSSLPLGSVLPLNGRAGLGLLLNEQDPWPEDLPENLQYAFKGYMVDEMGVPSFQYRVGKAEISDHISLHDDQRSLRRQLSVSAGLQAELAFFLAKGSDITDLGKGLYSIDQEFYVRVEKSGGKVEVRETPDGLELLMKVDGRNAAEIDYVLTW